MTVLEKAAMAAWMLTSPGLKETEVEAVWNNQDTKEKLMFVALARATLLAVRDLPECVADEYFSRCSLGGDLTPQEGDLPGHPINSAWPGMIDAILNEEPSA